MNNWFERFSELNSDDQKKAFQAEIMESGFSSLNQFISSFRDAIKFMDENEFKKVKVWLDLGNELLPNLESVSPAWENLWQELTQIYVKKVELFSEVSEEDRDGEWQIIYDNPFSNQELVCIPNKTFTEATYLMAKYLLDLKKAEYVKLQKVLTAITKQGL